jgi:hypothetical protein
MGRIGFGWLGIGSSGGLFGHDNKRSGSIRIAEYCLAS